MISTINATVLFVSKFEACVEFYRDTLGFAVKDTDEGFASFAVGDHEFALMSISAAADMISEEIIQPKKAGVPRLLFGAFLEDTDKAYEELKAKGVKFIKPPTTQPWGQRTAYFTDPDGNIWEISHFLPSEE